jgi:hypothetical protein
MATAGVNSLLFDMVAKMARLCFPMVIPFVAFNNYNAWFLFFKRLSHTVYICERMSSVWAMPQYDDF